MSEYNITCSARNGCEEILFPSYGEIRGHMTLIATNHIGIVAIIVMFILWSVANVSVIVNIDCVRAVVDDEQCNFIISQSASCVPRNIVKTWLCATLTR